MEKSKKISFTSIAIVVLAILLTVSLTMGGTLAWFANQNQAGTTLTMGNAVGVAVVDEAGTNGSMDRLSFQFNTGRNGELMLPGTQIDPDVRAMIARSNTNVILRAVVTFEVTLDNKLLPEQKTQVATKAGATLSSDGFMVVPSSVAAALVTGGSMPTTLPTDPIDKELYLLNELYTSFFATLQRSALYNGWVYRESNVGAEGKVFEGDSAKAASSTYFVAGKTQYSNTPITVNRSAGLGKTQYEDSTRATDDEVLYNAFYFRGWKTESDATYTEPANTQEALKGAAAADGSSTTHDPSTYTYELDNRGIDGYYRVVRSNGSIVRQDYLGGGRQYFATRAEAATSAKAGTSLTDPGEYAILEGTHQAADNTFARTADTLGYRKGDYTGIAATTDSFSRLNVATDAVNGTGQTVTINNAQDSWQSSGVRAANEDMMCVLNTNAQTVKVPLFTTSFILPTTWTQDAFADRSMRLNVTFQVMQADYLASGSSHHCSVELAESRFDDVTIWAAEAGAEGSGIVAGQPYVKNVADQPDFDNPEFWTGEYGATGGGSEPPAGGGGA